MPNGTGAVSSYRCRATVAMATHGNAFKKKKATGTNGEVETGLKRIETTKSGIMQSKTHTRGNVHLLRNITQ